MRHLVILLLLLTAFCPTTFSQNSEDCVDAFPLAPSPTPLSVLPDIFIDSLIGSGIEPAEWGTISALDCGPDGYTAQQIDKSYWFSFAAETNGTLELMITPEDLGTDYDFAIYKGFCPTDQCSEPIFCLWRSTICVNYSATGMAADPLTTFGEDPNTNIQVVSDVVNLDEGQNYFILVENRNESIFPECPIDDNLGFTIDFDGTATIGPLVQRPTVEPLLPLDTSETLMICTGDIVSFAVTEVPFASNYDWISKSSVSGINVTPNALGDSATIEFNGEGVGQICMEIICPIQSLICWDVQVDQIPDLEALPFPNVSCEPVDLNTRFRDNNNVASPVAFYETADDATNQTNPLTNDVVTLGGNYWARKNTPNDCSDIVQMDVQVNYIQVSVIDTFGFCPSFFGRNFVDLRQDVAPLISVNNAQSNDVYRFYEDSTVAVNNGAPITGGIVSEGQDPDNTYWVKVERQGQNPGDCFGLASFVIIFDAAPEIAPITDQEFCGNDCFQLGSLALFQPDGQVLSVTNRSFYTDSLDADAGNINNTLPSSEVCTSGTYWVRAESSASCYDIASFKLTFFPAPNIVNDTLDIDCTAGCIDLTDYGTDRNGLDPSILNTAYFDNQAAAEDPAATPLADIVFCNPTQVWMRMTNTDNGCFDVAQITIQGMPLPTATLSVAQTICEGDMTNLEITLTGDAPFVIQYGDGTTFFDETVPTNIFRTSVSPDTTTIYTLVSLMDSNGCTGTATGSTTITVNNSPIVSNFSENCTPSALEYQISFDIIGNDTYTVTGISGNQTGNSFESDVIPSGDPYSFQIAGTNGCDDFVQMPIFFNCECNSVVGTMDLQPKTYCEREPAIANYLGSGLALEKDDVLIYVLHESNDTNLVNPIIISNDPVFVFEDATMIAGFTYYMSAVVTKLDNTGEPIVDGARNPCMDVAQGQPVTFYPIPTVSLSLSATTICQGEQIDLTFNIEGIGPYDLIYFDGEKQVLLTDIDSGRIETIMPQFNTQVYVESINSTIVTNCENMLSPIDNQLDIIVNAPPVIENITERCNEEGSRLILTFEVTGGDPASYLVDGLTGSFKGNEFISDSLTHGTPYALSISDANNCPSPVINEVAECFCTPDITVDITTVKEVSCAGDQNGILMASPQNGMGPYTYFWSTGETTESINNVAPSVTNFVTMTDANGCEVMDSITLVAPTSVIATTNILDPTCFGANDGVILIVQTDGGTENYTYSFNGGSFQPDGIKDNFKAGVYPVAVRDENDCEWSGEVTLQNPPQFDVNLGGSAALNLGDSMTLNPMVNLDDGMLSFVWESSDPNSCLDCSNQVIKPSTTNSYKVTATNTAGCTASAEILVQVQNQRRLFIPSVFSPNGDGNNDLLRPFSGSEVKDIAMFRIYNRWGELIYEKEDMDMNSGLDGWDGITKTGRKAPPGVYLYYTEISWSNGAKDIITGDVSLVR